MTIFWCWIVRREKNHDQKLLIQCDGFPQNETNDVTFFVITTSHFWIDKLKSKKQNKKTDEEAN